MLAVDNLEVRYGGITALRGVSIDVAEGETVLLIGANGAGKSSLINAVIGLVTASRGSVRFAGADISAVSCDGRARAGMGYSPEGRRVFPTMSVADNVLSGACGRGGAAQREAWSWLCGIFPILQERAGQPAGQLSGGQQQIVALARAMSSFPKLLLLDEPFLGLAPVWIVQISEAIRHMQRRGTTILMTEQMARPALKLATRGYVMRGGEIRRSGTVAEIRDVALAEEYL
ncbi:ABC transporter ATP-binding protein [Bradyrhizobium sp. KBS0727]|jgi:branched-chain amino acid transport system ATP-binding protein|uniref:ABC transporter ATP-binding protein n=1 Tax=unclassified Bradyrhizobium TaxID=2631580 RepID=UPI00110E1306|nr:MULTISPECIES: ABC transporter ATP-binding protein [unclassified Bradyrhizobium]QDW39929.1 ABC transporter ATP-binding protein [Bradyrhizobium sp. KBS0725]QDW46532.1 ABC transporter ATP-binding protein [Bradyrhizobium sp. KBS0727]